MTPSATSAPRPQLLSERSPLGYTGLALLFTLLWASAFIGVKVGLRDSPPLFLMAFRFLLAALPLLLVARLRGDAMPATRGGWLRLAALGLLNYAGYLGLSAIALRYVTAGMGAVLASTNPLMLAALAALLLGERLSGRTLIGLALAFGSVLAIMASRLGVSSEPFGIALLLVANAIMVVGTVLFKHWAPQSGLLTLNGTQLLVAGLALLPLSAAAEPLGGIAWTPELLLAFAYLAFAVSCGAMVIWFALLRGGSASRASAYLFLNPVLGLALGALLLGESVRAVDLAGGVGVALGIYLVQRSA